MKLSVCPYKLIPISKQLNSQTYSAEKFGTLVRLNYGSNKIGYSDFHNGEDTLSMSLFDLKRYFSNIKGPQWEQTLYMARLMSQQGSFKSDQLKKVNSHFLIQNILNFTDIKLLKAETLGFKLFKVKMGKALRAETVALKNLVAKSAAGTKFRLDFNCAIEKKEFVIWLDKNIEALGPKIDFIEDPIDFKPGLWRHLERKYQVDLALDMAHPVEELDIEEIPKVIVLKPAIQNIEKIVDRFIKADVYFVVTHYMDHPIGQLGANFRAQALKHKVGPRLLEGGLLGFDMFEKNIFSQIKFADQKSVPKKVFSKKSWGTDFIVKDLKWLDIT